MVANRQRQHVDLAAQVRPQADVGGDEIERADVRFAVVVAQPGSGLLPVLALVGHLAVAAVGDHGCLGRRHHAVDGGRRSIDRLGRIDRPVLDFEERVLAHGVVHLLGEVERGKLQQPHGMLQARGDGVLLSLAGL
jgi:hypothetical protein